MRYYILLTLPLQKLLKLRKYFLIFCLIRDMLSNASIYFQGVFQKIVSLPLLFIYLLYIKIK